MTQLSRAALAALPARVRRPDFDPARLGTGIVHLGIGAFARAHIAAFTQPLLAADPSWGMLGVSLRRSDTRDALAPQDFLYTRAERDGTGERLEVMGALTGIAVGAADALARLVDPAVRIVTITVTEKGYGRDLDAAAMGRDSMPGLLATALHRRRSAGVAPFTVLSCDNLPSNGAVTRDVVARFARSIDPGFARFVAQDVAFPDSMVDRIVPATTPQDRAGVDAALGVTDAWPVICEPFTQWVIEDHFPQGRPAWERSGAELVSDVRPYEDMKLRLLNGSHSSIAYLGQLAGWETVADAVAEPALRAHIAALMQEVAATLAMPASVDLEGYCRALLTRFANPALRHRTAQIAMDGSQKLRQRLFAPALVRMEKGLPAPRIALGIAAWLRFLQGRADDGSALGLDDPQADRLRAAAANAPDPPALCRTVFAMEDIVPPALAAKTPFRDEVLAALARITERGVREALRTN
ncbi:MAG TPA: mannitol dehydrogenase family protein [Rhodopila sp.]|uniref:mannitol dehydrogenase family protein n=1 Tax=Rhodopila sp. TaxID=2480087 RepID=UPI002D19B569|nr:mannitol dehydrogenase family protein [Rhodopila sp.]HVY13898.1 mannitol dehydrogenase family protein [Rhodopila sp.]